MTKFLTSYLVKTFSLEEIETDVGKSKTEITEKVRLKNVKIYNYHRYTLHRTANRHLKIMMNTKEVTGEMSSFHLITFVKH